MKWPPSCANVAPLDAGVGAGRGRVALASNGELSASFQSLCSVGLQFKLDTRCSIGAAGGGAGGVGNQRQAVDFGLITVFAFCCTITNVWDAAAAQREAGGWRQPPAESWRLRLHHVSYPTSVWFCEQKRLGCSLGQAGGRAVGIGDQRRAVGDVPRGQRHRLSAHAVACRVQRGPVRDAAPRYHRHRCVSGKEKRSGA